MRFRDPEDASERLSRSPPRGLKLEKCTGELVEKLLAHLLALTEDSNRDPNRGAITGLPYYNLEGTGKEISDAFGTVHSIQHTEASRYCLYLNHCWS